MGVRRGMKKVKPVEEVTLSLCALGVRYRFPLHAALVLLYIERNSSLRRKTLGKTYESAAGIGFEDVTAKSLTPYPTSKIRCASIYNVYI